MAYRGGAGKTGANYPTGELRYHAGRLRAAAAQQHRRNHDGVRAERARWRALPAGDDRSAGQRHVAADEQRSAAPQPAAHRDCEGYHAESLRLEELTSELQSL